MTVDEKLLRFVAAQKGGVLATIRRNGRPQLSMHVSSEDFWTWVAVEGTAELAPVAADPHDATVEELIAYYRGVSGEHENWDEYRAAMVADRRLVVRFTAEHTYGRVRG